MSSWVTTFEGFACDGIAVLLHRQQTRSQQSAVLLPNRGSQSSLLDDILDMHKDPFCLKQWFVMSRRLSGQSQTSYCLTACINWHSTPHDRSVQQRSWRLNANKILLFYWSLCNGLYLFDDHHQLVALDVSRFWEWQHQGLFSFQHLQTFRWQHIPQILHKALAMCRLQSIQHCEAEVADLKNSSSASCLELYLWSLLMGLWQRYSDQAQDESHCCQAVNWVPSDLPAAQVASHFWSAAVVSKCIIQTD